MEATLSSTSTRHPRTGRVATSPVPSKSLKRSTSPSCCDRACVVILRRPRRETQAPDLRNGQRHHVGRLQPNRRADCGRARPLAVSLLGRLCWPPTANASRCHFALVSAPDP